MTWQVKSRVVEFVGFEYRPLSSTNPLAPDFIVTEVEAGSREEAVLKHEASVKVILLLKLALGQAMNRVRIAETEVGVIERGSRP